MTTNPRGQAGRITVLSVGSTSLMRTYLGRRVRRAVEDKYDQRLERPWLGFQVGRGGNRQTVPFLDSKVKRRQDDIYQGNPSWGLSPFIEAYPGEFMENTPRYACNDLLSNVVTAPDTRCNTTALRRWAKRYTNRLLDGGPRLLVSRLANRYETSRLEPLTPASPTRKM